MYTLGEGEYGYWSFVISIYTQKIYFAQICETDYTKEGEGGRGEKEKRGRQNRKSEKREREKKDKSDR